MNLIMVQCSIYLIEDTIKADSSICLFILYSMMSVIVKL